MAGNLFVTPSQAERYPHFTQLLQDLLEHKVCVTNLVTKSKNEQRQNVFHEYQRIRNEYEAVKLVYDSIWDILADSSLEEDVRNFLYIISFTHNKLNLNLLYFSYKRNWRELFYHLS